MHAGKPQKQSLAIAYAVKKRGKKMYKGGDAHMPQSYQGHLVKHAKKDFLGTPESPERTEEVYYQAKDEARERAKMAPKSKYPKHFAEGGECDPIVARIMAKGYSEGGKVANDDHAFEYEFEEPNEFDDLALHDDLEEHYDDENSGDELGGPSKDDLVARAMMKRRKQHNPRPA